MSWEPIRNEVMRVARKYSGGVIEVDDMRLIRQNFDSWEKGKILGDEKFQFIDLYVRDLALTGSDNRALDLVKTWKFRQVSAMLSTMYMRANGSSGLSDRFISELPYTYISPELFGTWFSCIALKMRSVSNEVVSVCAAYLPKPIETFGKDDFLDVVFFEGYLIPLETVPVPFPEGSSNRLICSLKLTRPEFRGLGGVGYAEAELSLIYSVSNGALITIQLNLPSPLISPRIETDWSDKIIEASDIFIKNPKKNGLQNPALEATNFLMSENDKYFKVLEEMFDFSYKGYLY